MLRRKCRRALAWLRDWPYKYVDVTALLQETRLPDGEPLLSPPASGDTGNPNQKYDGRN